LINIVTRDNRHLFHDALKEMHRQRKELFIDRMGWRLEHLAGLEIDAFDRESAVYLIETSPSGRVVQSARLLATHEPHLLGEVFSELCIEGPPRSQNIWEASRFCPAPSTPKGEQRRALLMRMIGAIMETSILHGVEAVTFVASKALAPLAREAGWEVEDLGPEQRLGRERVIAMRAAITSAGLAKVRALNRLSGPLTCYADPMFARAA
jgi:acyl-homoserine lactone synthase